MVVMPKTVTVSAKVPEELRKKMSELGIVPSDVIRKALEEAVRDRSRQLLLEQITAASAIAKKVSEEEWVRAIRESRDSR
jgi:antitoxin component of RelBE/YafQ-DinJ toxin-antitoxin module